jgi:hypothetical protein
MFFIGVILLLITAADLINTSLSGRGAGFISKRLSNPFGAYYWQW